MIYIQKSNEPRYLKYYKKQLDASYTDCDKKDIRKSLLLEQGYLCAYCMRRIDETNFKIEHWKPQEGESRSVHALDYNNMLAVCSGHKKGDKGNASTCDTSKGSQHITVNPLVKATLSTIEYKLSTGDILARDEMINYELNNVLNLNSSSHYLPTNRKTKIQEVINCVSRKRNNGEWTSDFLDKYIASIQTPNKDGRKSEYLGIVLWYLEKKTSKGK